MGELHVYSFRGLVQLGCNAYFVFAYLLMTHFKVAPKFKKTESFNDTRDVFYAKGISIWSMMHARHLCILVIMRRTIAL